MNALKIEKQVFHNRHDNTCFYSADTVSVVTSDLLKVKNQTAQIYKEVGDYITNASRNMHSFNKMITPYIDYFFTRSTSSERECFINDVIVKSHDTMRNAFEKTLEIIKNDTILYEEIAGLIDNALHLKNNIDEIITVIDDIEIYYLNMMVASVRAGGEGMVLTRLSEEMGKLSTATNTITGRFWHIIDRLDATYVNFCTTRTDLETRQQEHSGTMGQHIEEVFNTLINDFDVHASETNINMAGFHDLKQIFDNIITKLQMEDIYTQNIDKIVFAMNVIVENVPGLSVLPLQERVKNRSFLEKIICDKITAIHKDAEELRNGFNNFMEISKSLVSDLISKTKNNADVIDDSHALDKLYDIVENLRNGFIKKIEEMIKSKKEIYMFFENILNTIRSFGDFFPEINQILKKFDVVNMMTKMEIVRNRVIEKEFSGSLADISIRPKMIKSLVDNAGNLYDRIKCEIEMSVDTFKNTLSYQEENLSNVIASLQQVSVKLHESKKYHCDIINEIHRQSEELDDFLGQQRYEFDKLNYASDLIAEIHRRITEECDSRLILSREAIINDAHHYKQLKNQLLNKIPDNEYRKLMITSFFNEYLETQQNSEIVFFN